MIHTDLANEKIEPVLPLFPQKEAGENQVIRACLPELREEFLVPW